jgi:hypothetical protein
MFLPDYKILALKHIGVIQVLEKGGSCKTSYLEFVEARATAFFAVSVHVQLKKKTTVNLGCYIKENKTLLTFFEVPSFGGVGARSRNPEEGDAVSLRVGLHRVSLVVGRARARDEEHLLVGEQLVRG